MDEETHSMGLYWQLYKIEFLGAVGGHKEMCKRVYAVSRMVLQSNFISSLRTHYGFSISGECSWAQWILHWNNTPPHQQIFWCQWYALAYPPHGCRETALLSESVGEFAPHFLHINMDVLSCLTRLHIGQNMQISHHKMVSQMGAPAPSDPPVAEVDNLY